MDKFRGFGSPDVFDIVDRYDNEAALNDYKTIDVNDFHFKAPNLPLTHLHCVMDDNDVEHIVMLNIVEINHKDAVSKHDLPSKLYENGGYKVDAYINSDYVATHFYSNDPKSTFNIKNTEGVAYDFFGDYMFMKNRNNQKAKDEQVVDVESKKMFMRM